MKLKLRKYCVRLILASSLGLSTLGLSATKASAEPSVGVGVACSTTGPGAGYCYVAAGVALVTLGLVHEFSSGKPFGRGNDFRVLGGNISKAWKKPKIKKPKIKKPW